MLRIRDVLAALAAVWVSRLAWDDPSESVAATAHLSWYVGRSSSSTATTAAGETQNKGSTGSSRYLPPVPFDVDGDGSAESLVGSVYYHGISTWKLQILDLQPATRRDKTHVAPFAPKVMYESPPVQLEEGVSMREVQPIAHSTGHVQLAEASSTSAPDAGHQKYKDHKLDDKNRHYFCGSDWHDASQKCGTPCPGGQTDECPDGERCFADTPCDIMTNIQQQSSKARTAASKPDTIDGLYVTPAGTLPCIFTLWSTGTLTMHALTAPSGEEQRKSKRVAPRLKMLLNAGQRDGMVLVQAAVDYFPNGTATEMGNAPTDGGAPPQLDTKLFLTALDGRTGKVLWETDVLKSYTDVMAEEAKVPWPIQPGTTSTARRRSGLPYDMHDHMNEGAVPPCLHNFRRSLLTSGALPYLYWGDDDAVVQALHFETQPPNAKSHAKQKQTHHKRHFHHGTAHRGKPNVVVSKTHRGLQVRSLRNGRSICHVSLWHETLYADLNHDGVLDATFMMTGKHRLPGEDEAAKLNEDEKWIYKLMLRVVEEEESRVSSQTKRQRDLHHVCHSMTLSGIPPREELFSAPLCEPDHEQNEALPEETEAAPPLAVEAMRGKGYDLIMAVNNGLLHRVRNNGRKQWELKGHVADFPMWEDGSYVRLDRISAPRVLPSTRPVILTGDTSMALIAPRTGTLLSTATFPQPVESRPILMDFNGDGTTDVLVTTADAFWGYRVHVRTGSSVVFRILVGLLLMGVMLAILQNRFGSKPGKRSTDL